MIISLPKGEKNVAVSFTISPVTHTADADVKIASTKFILDFGSFREIGKERRSAPESIKTINPKIITSEGLTFLTTKSLSK